MDTMPQPKAQKVKSLMSGGELQPDSGDSSKNIATAAGEN
jgi:hypothetical protein